jgi:hypothetical protein
MNHGTRRELVLDSSWTPAAVAIFERACEHYGGLDTWRALKRVRLIPERLSGLLPRVKGVGRTFTLPASFEIEPHERRALFMGYPDQEHVGVFENGAVTLQRRDGSVVQSSADHRESFRGLAKNRRWSPLDALYFFGYALTHYHALPFTLIHGRLVSAKRVGSGRDALSVLDIELPADLPTHSRRQRFYFEEGGRLSRHDYLAEVVGYWARGAHFWNRQTVVRGFPIALERHVSARLGTVALPITALHATFRAAEVELGGANPT